MTLAILNLAYRRSFTQTSKATTQPELRYTKYLQFTIHHFSDHRHYIFWDTDILWK